MVKRRKKKKKNWKKPAILLILIIFLTCILFAIYLVIVNYFQVSRFIEQGHSSSKFVVYAATKNFYQGQKTDLASFIDTLRERGYTLKKFTTTEISDSLKTNTDNKSYYQDQGFVFLEIPAFINEKNEKQVSRKISYNPYTGKIIALDKGLANFQLEPLPIYIKDGQSIRTTQQVDLDNIPTRLQEIILAIEDRNFYKHFGIDPLGIFRALFVNIKNQGLVQGGSTVTQQLSKNLFLTNRKSLSRKINEAIAAIILEFKLSKREILELYLNESYFGQQGNLAIHGIKNASKVFFGKDLKDLKLSEQVALTAILQAPTLYSPWKINSKLTKRKNELLNILLELKTIDLNEFNTANAESLVILPKKLDAHRAPFFIQSLFADRSIKNEISLNPGKALSIYTGLDSDIQFCAEKSIIKNLTIINKNRASPLNAALLALEPHSGIVKAWVGGINYKNSQFDNVIQAQRPIASLVKPFIYLSAFNNFTELNPNSNLIDRELKIIQSNGKTWSPSNYDHKFLGTISIRKALEQSRNIPAVKLSQKIRFNQLAEFLIKIKLSEKIEPLPSIALGAIDSSLLKIARAYSMLANDGIMVEPRLYTSVRSANGELLRINELKEDFIAPAGSVFLINDILKGAIQRGTGIKIKKSGFNSEVAGKTGTSNDARDTWFVGYTPRFLAAIWIGEKNNASTGATGGTLAAPIWADFMKCIEPSAYETPFIKPLEIEKVNIDLTTGSKATKFCPKEITSFEYFQNQKAPRKFCKLHGHSITDDVNISNNFFENQIEKTPEFKTPVAVKSQEEEFQTTNRRRKGSFLDYLEKNGSSQ